VIGDDVEIEADAVVGRDAQVGKEVKIGRGAKIGKEAVIGDNVYLEAGLAVLNNQSIEDNRWIDRSGVWDRLPDGSQGSQLFEANSEEYRAKIKLVAAADPIPRPGSSLREDPSSGAGTGAVVADVPSEGEAEGEAIERNARLKDADAAKELWKGFLAEGAVDPLVDSSGVELGGEAARGKLGLDIGRALYAALRRLGVDLKEYPDLVRELQRDVVDPMERFVDEAVATVEGRGEAVTRDRVSAELGKRSVYDAFGGDPADPKSKERGRKTAAGFELIRGNDAYVAVIVGHYLANGDLQAKLTALGRNGNGANSEFNKRWLDRTDGDSTRLKDVGLKNAQWMQAELLRAAYQKQKAAGQIDSGTTFDQYVKKELSVKEADELKETMTESFGVTVSHRPHRGERRRGP
jgi:hypothetical protein